MKRSDSPFNKFNREKGSLVSLIKNRISSSSFVPPSFAPCICICNAALVDNHLVILSCNEGRIESRHDDGFVEVVDRCPPTESSWKPVRLEDFLQEETFHFSWKARDKLEERWTLTLPGRMAAMKKSFIEVNRSFYHWNTTPLVPLDLKWLIVIIDINTQGNEWKWILEF